MNEGVLRVNGTNTGDIEVNRGGTLSGHGVVAGTVTVRTDGMIAPYLGETDAPSTLTVDSIVFENNSRVQVKLNGADGNDALVINSTAEVNLTGVTLDVVTTDWVAPETSIQAFSLLSLSPGATLTGEFSNYANGATVFTADGSAWQILYGREVDSNGQLLAATAGDNDVVLAAVPEPATIAMLTGLGGAGCLAWLVHRKRRKGAKDEPIFSDDYLQPDEPMEIPCHHTTRRLRADG